MTRTSSGKTARTFFLGGAFAIASFLLPSLVFAAELSFSPSSGTNSVGKEFSVKVLVNPGADSINAADGTLGFDKDLLSVSSVSKDGSAFSLWTADPTFSNTDGTITFSGGTPTAFSKSGTVITIKFKPLKVGSAKVTVTTASILAADGKGTNVYAKGNSDATYTISAAAAAPPPAPTPAADSTPPPADDTAGQSFGGSLPIAPALSSPTQPKEESWYSTSTVTMQWKSPPDLTGLRTLFSSKNNLKPNVNQKITDSSQTIPGVGDGTWYYYIQYKNEAGWGDITMRKVQIDSVPPDAFEITLLADGDNATSPKLSIQTKDDLSGMDRYEISIGTSSAQTVKDSDLVNGATPLPPQPGGDQTVHVKAYDKAGNIRESEKILTLPKVAKPSSKGAKADEVVPQSPWTSERILLIIFAFIIGILGTVNMYGKKAVVKDRLRALQELSFLRDKNDKIFSAMREEFELMVQNLDDKPQLTPVERDMLENIKEVIEISEELVDSGMDELKKTIRG